MKITIVGAGMAGLACAEALSAQGHDLTLLDKGRGAGGRMSTRRLATALGEAHFDHGAQYFTVRDPQFQARVRRWLAAGCVAPWPAAGADAHVGVPAMNAPLRDMAAPFEVHWGVRVTKLESSGQDWRLVTDGGPVFESDAVVVALPAEQARALVATSGVAFEVLSRAPPTAPCWTVMLAFAEALPTRLDCFRGPEGRVLGWAARNSAKPGRTGPEAWVLQASPDWSHQYLEAAPDWVRKALSGALYTHVGVDPPQILDSSVHRWRFARSGRQGAGAVWDSERRLGLCGDWLLGPRVEAAWISGTKLADQIAAWDGRGGL